MTQMFLQMEIRREGAIALEGTSPGFPVVLRDMSAPLTSSLEIGVVVETVLKYAGIRAKVTKDVASRGKF